MGNRVILSLLACASILSLFTACSKNSSPTSADYDEIANDEPVNTVRYEVTTAYALAGNIADHEASGDYIWDAAKVTSIHLDDNSKSVNGSGAAIDGSIVTISSAGTYSISGSLSEGQIIVDSKDESVVRLILNGIDITCSASAPIFIKNAAKAVIVLAENTNNFVHDGTAYVFEESEEDEPNAAIFSKENLTIYGNGSLKVNGNYNDGIASKDGLIIKSGAISVESVDDGIRGKDYLIIKNGDITVDAGGDGLKSDDSEDAAHGYVYIENGDVTITSGGDAIDAETDALIRGGDIHLTSGGGSGRRADESISTKGIKGVANTIIDDGTITINSSDDAVHSNGYISINGGSFDISTGDDAIHADTTLGINGGDIEITKSFEGLESRSVIAISNGDIHIISSDDGVNIAAGGGMGGFPWQGFPGQGGITASGNRYLYISGGHIAVNATGDGMDINGSIVMTGGDVLIDGPTSNMNGALDYDASFKITGGFLVAAGSSGMAQAPGTSSTQYSVLLYFTSMQQAGTIIHIQTSAGEDVLSFSPIKQYTSVAFSSSKLKKGLKYDIYYGGSSTGTLTDGLYQGGTYSPGAKYASFTVSGVITTVGGR